MERIESIRSTRESQRELRRATWTLGGLFLLSGVLMSSWLARLPSVRDALDLTPAELGVVLLAGAVGALSTVALAGPIVARFGGRVAMVGSTVALAAAFALIGLGPALGNVVLLAAGIFLNGVSFALFSVPLNVESAGIERRMGRTILPRFHAAFSVGAVLGSLLGAACAHAHVPLLVQFLVTAVVAVAWRLVSIPTVIHDTAVGGPRVPAADREGTGAGMDGGSSDPARGNGSQEPVGPRPADGGTPRRVRFASTLGAWREPRTLLIGLVIMAASLSEGSANDWLSLAVVDGFSQTEAVGALVFGAFVAAMTVMRFVGTWVIDRFGRVVVLRISGLVSIGGLLLFGFAPNLLLAGFGVVAWGIGAALAVPLGIAAASDEPLRAAGRVAVVSAFSSMASLAAPPLLGLVAESVGARRALVLIVAAMILSVLLARQVAPLPGGGGSATVGGRTPDGPGVNADCEGPVTDIASHHRTIRRRRAVRPGMPSRRRRPARRKEPA